MIKLVGSFLENFKKMFIALVEFNYEEEIKEMERK